MSNRRPLTWRVGAAVFGGFMIVASMLGYAVAHDETPEAQEGSGIIVDRGCSPIDVCRAQRANIFVGDVMDVVVIHEPEGELPLSGVVYTVDVGQVFHNSRAPGPEGRAPSGRTQIQVVGLCLHIEDGGRAAPLVVGERYLFFAGLDVGEGYLVDGDIGFLPVSSNEEAERLIDALAPFIRQSDRQEQEAIAQATEAARYEPTTPPAAQITPERGPAGSEVTVSGSGFSPSEVLFLWDEANPLRLPSVEVPRSGEFSVTLTVPERLDPGQHTLAVEGLGSDVVELTFVVE